MDPDRTEHDAQDVPSFQSFLIQTHELHGKCHTDLYRLHAKPNFLSASIYVFLLEIDPRYLRLG
jgi:hypothetical protein